VGSQYEPKMSAALKQAFHDAWRVLKARQAASTWEGEMDLRSDLSSTLMELAEAGITEPNELCDQALDRVSSRAMPAHNE
jgi:hypothetical protein